MNKSEITTQRKSPAVTPSAPPKVVYSPNLLTLPPELRCPIILKLPVRDALNIRLTCRTLNTEVLSFYPAFQMYITGDNLSTEQLAFLDRIRLKRITFKRVAKPIKTYLKYEEDDEDMLLPSSSSQNLPACTRKQQYNGPCQYFQVGGVQIRSFTAPVRVIKNRITPQQKQQCKDDSHKRSEFKEKYVYDYAILRDYLISNEDIFKDI